MAAKLSPSQEQIFRAWYAGWASHLGLPKNPDKGDHDYRQDWARGVTPSAQVDPATSPPDDDARTGELGIMRRPDGSDSSEISITVTDPRLNDGKPTNIPLLVRGQKDVDALLSGQRWTHEQEDIAVRRAIERVGTGAPLPSFGSIEEAVKAAQERSNQGGSVKKFRPGSAVPSLTTLASAEPEAAPSGTTETNRGPNDNGMMPLIDYMQMLTDPNWQSPDKTAARDAMVEPGANAVLDALKGGGPTIPPGAQRYLPETMTDAEPVHRQIDLAVEQYPEHFIESPDAKGIPRPGEYETPRERAVRDGRDYTYRTLATSGEGI